MFIEELFEELSELKQVEAIALSGSRATGKGDEKSDYDVYVYVMEEVSNEIRKKFWENIVLKPKSEIITGSQKITAF